MGASDRNAGDGVYCDYITLDDAVMLVVRGEMGV